MSNKMEFIVPVRKQKWKENTAFLFGRNACGQFPEASQMLQRLTSILDLEARGGGESSLSALQLTVSLITLRLLSSFVYHLFIIGKYKKFTV